MPAQCGPNAAGSTTTSGQRTSINDIPEELLISVFELSLQVKLMNRPSTLCRLRLTCQWWEQVIQRTPSLWSNVCSLHGVKWTKLALQRSNLQPLTAEVTGFSNRAAIATVVRELHRTEALSVILPFRPAVNQSPALAHLHQPAPPALKNLSLSSMEDNPHDPVIFGGQWTHVRSLQIAQVNLDWDGCKLSRLERLVIRGKPKGSSRPDLAQLLHVFDCCQDLEYVQLWEVGLKVGPSLPTKVITLPKLTTFIVTCSMRPFIELLLAVRLPNCQFFEFREEASIGGPMSKDLSRLLDALMPIVETRSVQHKNPSNFAFYLPRHRDLIMQCHLDSLVSASGMQFNLHIQGTWEDNEFEMFQKSYFWRVFEDGGLVIDESALPLSQSSGDRLAESRRSRFWVH